MKTRLLATTSVWLMAAAVQAGTVILFGGKPEWIQDPMFKKQIGATEVVQWNGVTHLSKSFGAAGSLDDKTVGATLTAPESKLTLTSRSIGSSIPERTHTVQDGFQLGINAVKSTEANFVEPGATTWTFSFDKTIKLRQLIFNGIDHGADTIAMTIEGGETQVLVGKEIYGKTKDWSGFPTTRFKQFTPGITIPANTPITLSSAGSSQPELNKFGLAGIVVILP